MQIVARVQCATLHVNFWEGGDYKGKNSWLPFKSHQIGSRLNWLSILQYLIMKSPFTRYGNVNVTKWCRILRLRRHPDSQRNRSHLKHQHLTPAHPFRLINIAVYHKSTELIFLGLEIICPLSGLEIMCPFSGLDKVSVYYRV